MLATMFIKINIKKLLKIKFNKLCNLFPHSLTQEAASLIGFIITTLFKKTLPSTSTTLSHHLHDPKNELLQGGRKFGK